MLWFNNNVTVGKCNLDYLIVNFAKSDWYLTSSGPAPNLASLAVGGVKSTVNPSEVASI